MWAALLSRTVRSGSSTMLRPWPGAWASTRTAASSATLLLPVVRLTLRTVVCRSTSIFKIEFRLYAFDLTRRRFAFIAGLGMTIGVNIFTTRFERVGIVCKRSLHRTLECRPIVARLLDGWRLATRTLFHVLAPLVAIVTSLDFTAARTLREKIVLTQDRSLLTRSLACLLVLHAVIRSFELLWVDPGDHLLNCGDGVLQVFEISAMHDVVDEMQKIVRVCLMQTY